MGEFDLIERSSTDPHRVVLGSGDDCIFWPHHGLAAAGHFSDMLVEGRHFFP
jgi:thiamine monophosphate kinase